MLTPDIFEVPALRKPLLVFRKKKQIKNKSQPLWSNRQHDIDFVHHFVCKMLPVITPPKPAGTKSRADDSWTAVYLETAGNFFRIWPIVRSQIDKTYFKF